ncbi:hypothetical protein CN563_18740 [Bacillus sp. AFS026049]|nr:hypothetical protein CON84_14665 [Bacillus sp. AFS094228]PEO44909.1 hypothetical protein CN563_18740 [Bacillus sp. AFS026049]
MKINIKKFIKSNESKEEGLALRVKAFSVCRQKGFGIKNSEPLLEIPFKFPPGIKRLGLYKPTRLGHFWNLLCPIGHLF